MLPFELLQMLWHMKMKTNYQCSGCSGSANSNFRKKKKKIGTLLATLRLFR